eukprot:CAMPEP_0113558502 /NCGR_PEP_ID=MMETSP0015_2-20120614/18382_1 /TAXON_ID=2838 /ORGANISM="Odontella" /LENGTH=348 /DNA_ID=CAMNT_0000460045 /DNA_START=90 /DNA_END=1133 /DNA_ORIENTATION=+ /assembly_acc=CAM_ASM_000160
MTATGLDASGHAEDEPLRHGAGEVPDFGNDANDCSADDFGDESSERSLLEVNQPTKGDGPPQEDGTNGSGSNAGRGRFGTLLAINGCAAILILVSWSLWGRSGSGGGISVNFPEDDRPRPKMHTFYEKINQDTGMSNEADEALLSAWRTAWSAAGWDPVVLSSNDARRHPDYEELFGVLEKKGGFRFGEYDEMCFVRWIAMGAPNAEVDEKDNETAAGGWMADYDVFPLENFAEEGWTDNLPKGGRLTVYEANGGEHVSVVPSLVSGTAEEWTRMAWLLVQNYDAHRKDSFWSDMLALDDIGQSILRNYKGGDEEESTNYVEESVPFWPFETHDSVVEAKNLLKGDHW